MACKVEYKDLEEITKYLDKILKKASKYPRSKESQKDFNDGLILSQKIKDKYTEIKPDYDK